MLEFFFSLVVILLLPLPADGLSILSPFASAVSIKAASSSSTLLHVGAVLQESEDEARYWLGRATDCAYSTGRFCSVEEAQQCLNEIIDIESACTMGTMNAEDVCEINSQSMLPEIVERLKEKIPNSLREGLVASPSSAAASSSASTSRQANTGRAIGAFGAYMLLGLVWMITRNDSKGVVWTTPTAEELFSRGFLS